MPRSVEDLTTAAAHVNYELRALVGCYRRFLVAENEAHEHPAEVLAANSYLEAMLVHARCLIEFIARRRDVRDIHRHDYLPEWDPATKIAEKRMCSTTGSASTWGICRGSGPYPPKSSQVGHTTFRTSC
jgi:hypothetical protein